MLKIFKTDEEQAIRGKIQKLHEMGLSNITRVEALKQQRDKLQNAIADARIAVELDGGKFDGSLTRELHECESEILTIAGIDRGIMRRKAELLRSLYQAAANKAAARSENLQKEIDSVDAQMTAPRKKLDELSRRRNYLLGELEISSEKQVPPNVGRRYVGTVRNLREMIVENVNHPASPSEWLEVCDKLDADETIGRTADSQAFIDVNNDGTIAGHGFPGF